MSIVNHKFVSGKADSPDPTIVRPSNWNDDHKITYQVHTVTGVDAISITDDVVRLEAGTYAVTVPLASGSGKPIFVCQDGAGTITLIPTGGDTLGGQTSFDMMSVGAACVLVDEVAGKWGLLVGSSSSPSAPAFVKYFYAGTESLYVPLYSQALFGMTIEMSDGDLVVDGMLIDVS